MTAKGGFAPNGYARLFNTADPGRRLTGTPGLASSSIGNVLIVQAQNKLTPKASDTGVLTFTFVNPIDEVLEMGLLNVQYDVTIQITDSSGDVVDIVVSPDGSNGVRNVRLEVACATKIVVETNGPVGITGLKLCQDLSKTPSPFALSPPLTDSPSAMPSISFGPSAGPSASPSVGPSAGPSASPSTGPSAGPSASPSTGPSASPSVEPSPSPSESPSSRPSARPSAPPSYGPTSSPSTVPTTSPRAPPR